MSKDRELAIFNVYRTAPIFAESTDDELKKISELSKIKKFAKGEVIFTEGDSANYLYHVAEGRVKIYKSSPSGKIFTLMVASRGDPIISVQLYKESIRRFSAMAMDDVRAVSVKRTDFIKFAQAHPHIIFNTLNFIGDLFYSANDRIIDLIGENVEQRLINILCMLHARFGKTIYFSSDELADLSGTTPETVRRILCKLKSVGFIERGRGKTIVLDEGKLYNLSSRPYIF